MPADPPSSSMPQVALVWPSALPLGGQPSEYLDIFDVLLSPWPTIAQVRELLLHGEHRSLGVNALYPELDVAVLARDPADPRIEAPASEQPHWDTGCLRNRYDLADNTQLPFGLLVHGVILPYRYVTNGNNSPMRWTAVPLKPCGDADGL
jgi:hypothetical protein